MNPQKKYLRRKKPPERKVVAFYLLLSAVDATFWTLLVSALFPIVPLAGLIIVFSVVAIFCFFVLACVAIGGDSE